VAQPVDIQRAAIGKTQQCLLVFDTA